MKQSRQVYRFTFLFSASGFPVIMKFQPATCKKYLPFLGALPSGFEGVKKFALQKVEKITPLAGFQPFANTQGKLL